jgi:hypothetical protein
MTGFFQGLINKGNTKKAGAPGGVPEKKHGSTMPGKGAPSQLDPNLIGNNGVANGV